MPYVECDRRGTAADPARCDRAGVRRYPTWVIGSARYEGVLSLDELARASAWPGTAASQ